MSIKRTDISEHLINGILQDAVLTTDNSCLAVEMSGFYTVAELRAVLEDLVHLDSNFQFKKEGLSRDAITDTIVCLLDDNGRGENHPYLVYSLSDPDLTIELTDGSIVAKIKGCKVDFTGAVIDRASSIINAPIFDYKELPC